MERNRPRKIPYAMTIAGSDSIGGAGIEADLKTFSALGVYGTCVITAITAQNIKGVKSIFPASPRIVKEQIDAIMEDFKIENVKVGMLFSKGIVEEVSKAMKRYRFRMVVDPLFKAGTGTPLIQNEETVDSLIRKIIPEAYILTPNIHEAEEITGIKIENVNGMKKAAKKIHDLGAEAVIIKGGHLKGSEVIDLIYYEGRSRLYRKERIDINMHGGGCIFSSAITAHLALGYNIFEATERTEEFILEAIRNPIETGFERIIPNPMTHIYNEAERYEVLADVSRAVDLIEENTNILPWIAEVGTQVGMAVSYATSKNHIAAVEGRIVKTSRSARAVGCVKFGVSDHIARIILTVMKHNPHVRAALNLHYSPELISAFKRAGFKVSSFSRSAEPEENKRLEGKTLSWGVEEAIKQFSGVPDVIYDEGERGKEAMIRVLGKSASETVKKVIKALNNLQQEN